MSEREITIIKFEPALPCATVHGDTHCGKPATVAHVMEAPDLAKCMDWPPPGPAWLLLPVCEDCTRLTLEKYTKLLSQFYTEDQ